MVLCLLAVSVFAGAVSVSVSEFDLYVDPGSSLSTEFSVYNEESTRLHIGLELIDWDDTSDGAVVFYPAGQHAHSCAPWIQVKTDVVAVAPGSEATIGFSIDVPVGERGTRWCGLLLSVRPEDGSGYGLRRFLIKIFQTSLPATASGMVAGLEIGGLSPLTATVRFRNDGEVRLTDITGLIRVEDDKGTTILDESVRSFRLLPGHETTIPVETRWGLQNAGIYLLRAVFDFGTEVLVAGQTAFRIRELALVPLIESAGVPMDLDGDGLYEDVDGDGALDIADPNLLEVCLADAAVIRNQRAFDFTNDGIVNQEDVEWLHDFVSKASS